MLFRNTGFKMSSNGPCNNFTWSSSSAMNKLKSNVSVSVNAGPVGVSKQLTGPHDQ